jgi:sensor c-di-GMP phosphodiesterase-like protein
MSIASKRRILLGRLAIIATAACGMAVGYMLGCGLALIRANNWLENYADVTATRDNAALAEARNVLHTMQALRYGFCSNTEIANFRSVVFHSEYVKDAGRILGSKIGCSATSGRSMQTIGPFKPDFRLEDGSLAYRSLTPTQNVGLKRAALKLGSAYVVFGTELPPRPGPIPMHLAFTMKTSGNPHPGSVTTGTAIGNALYRPTVGRGLVGNTLYVTRCSDPGFDCVTASTSVPEALHGESNLLSSIAFLGGIAGVLIGMAFSSRYKHNRALDHQLRRGLKRDELKVLYQPIVNPQTRQIVGAEALARWTDEDGNAVEPEVFVKVAEDFGFVGSITKTVLQRILRDFAATLQNRQGFRISINVAAADLEDPDFLPMLEGSLQNANVLPESLVIEITERSATNSEEAKESIRNLRRLGHSIHIDDFGCGYSNLDKLLYLWADTIKIDKGFTQVIGTESKAEAILPQIMKLAKSMNLEVVVEGVECTRQADYFLPGEQKIYAQGWLYGRPMTAEAFLSELAGNPVVAPVSPEEFAVFTTKPGVLHGDGALVA